MSGTSSISRFATLLLWRFLKNKISNSSNVFNINNPLGLKLLTRLRIGFSHLKEHKFKHSFQDSVDPLCSCGNDIESTVHFFVHCPNFTTQRRTLLNKLKSINASIMTENEIYLSERSYLEDQTLIIQLTKKLLMQPLVSF